MRNCCWRWNTLSAFQAACAIDSTTLNQDYFFDRPKLVNVWPGARAVVGFVSRFLIKSCPGDNAVVGLESFAVLNTRPGLVPAWPGDSGMPKPMPKSMPCAVTEPVNATIMHAANSAGFM